jgi:hypothetical protein
MSGQSACMSRESVAAKCKAVEVKPEKTGSGSSPEMQPPSSKK